MTKLKKAYIVTTYDSAEGTVKIMDQDGVDKISISSYGYSITDFDSTVPSNF